MKPEFLKLMKCPYCGADVEIQDVYKEVNGKINYGYAKCACKEYPIVEGILNLKINPEKRYVLDFLKRGKLSQAARLSLGTHEDICRVATFLETQHLYGRLLSKIILLTLNKVTKYTYRKYWDKQIPFYNLLGKTKIYSKHRFSAETFWSLYPFIPILKRKNKRILDIGCGTGHASFVLSTYVKPQELICVDDSFENLYLAKKYFAPDAEFICLDANYSLPFKDGIFTSVFMLDAFHYVQARASLARETERILVSDGLLLLLHLHNSLSYNPGAGEPLPPSGWVNLFRQLPIKALAEGNFVEDFILRNRLDLVKEYTEAELDSSKALSIVGTRDISLLKVYEEVGKDFLSNKSNLIINPIYRIDYGRDSIILRLNFPSELFRREYPLTEKYLPEEYIVEGELAKRVNRRTLDTESSEISDIEDLMRRFIIINVPKGYC